VDSSTAIRLGALTGGEQSDNFILEKKLHELERDLGEPLKQLNAYDDDFLFYYVIVSDGENYRGLHFALLTMLQ